MSLRSFSFGVLLAATTAHAQPTRERDLASYLEAYAKSASPTILLDVAATLRDMGELADAANTYQRYLADPGADAHRIREIRELLRALDTQLATLTVRVIPSGCEVSIDGGPFVAVARSLATRVRPGLHLVRARRGDATREVTLNAFVGEAKDVPISLEAGAVPPNDPAPDLLGGWLIAGGRYSLGPGNTRRLRSDPRPEAAATPPAEESTVDGDAVAPPPVEHITSGVLAMMRIDGHGRGVAGGLGLAYASNDHVELEIALLVSDFYGGYFGGRYRVFTGMLRPYAAAGIPVFVFNDGTSTLIAPGARVAAGIELAVNKHVSLQADLGYEHFFNVSGAIYQGMSTIAADVFVPTLGVIGRL